MINVNDAKRLIKRVILANIVSDKENLALTPLISGKHGIGKSAIIKSIAKELDGVCITIEGGTLKEGEITGLPYQYKDDKGNIKFKFLPYYAVERIKNEEERIYKEIGEHNDDYSILNGDDNRYSLNNISKVEKIKLLKNKTIKPVILFIDEINRTENTVYKELMNILLTRSVNGYIFPWWVFFVGAMNPSTQNSVYATNEMDPAQLDRFIKLKVTDDTKEWLRFARNSNIDDDIVNFIKDNPKCLSVSSKDLEDEETPTPSPRGWDMVDTLLKSEPYLRDFFNEEENSMKVVEKDIKELISAKLGATVATMFLASRVSSMNAIPAEEILNDDEQLSTTLYRLNKLSTIKKVQTSDLMIQYLKDNIEFIMLDKKKFEKNKKQLKLFASSLDSSTRLLFAQKMAATNTDDGNSLIELLFDVFESELISVLDLSEKTKEAIEKIK